MNNEARVRRRWRRRAVTVAGLAVTTVATAAIPALAHPVFSNDAPGFPNPQGTAATPYPAGSRPTMNMFLPFEQEGVDFPTGSGNPNTTVDVKVTIPAGWTNPACGNASTSTGNRQVGSVVPGWTCTIETVNSHQVLHWTGPQITLPQTEAASAQFFTFLVTVPSPATMTTYGTGAIGTGAEGFYVEQVYASTVDVSLWRTPNSTRPGEVANGIVRTVTGAPPPTPTPTPVVTPTPTRTPVVTPTPTRTPVVTPTPTRTPVVTPTPQPGATATNTRLAVVRIDLPGPGGFVFPIAFVAPSDAAGTVQFKDRNTNLGSPVPVIAGVALDGLRFMPGGQHSLTAVFTPADPVKFLPSTSNAAKFSF